MKRIFVSFKMVNDYEQVLPEDWDAFLQEDAALDYVRQIVNCFDESALELALRIKDYYSQIGEETELTALTIANDSPSFFKTLFATGYDRVIRLTPSPGENFSPLSIADKILSFIREEQAGFDAFLFGQQRRYEFSVEARYGFGYGDILRNGTKYKGNPDRSPLDNINVFAAFYYRLGKEGIRSAPSAAAQQRMEQEAARHTLRRLNKMLDKGKIPADTLLLLTLPRDSAGNIPIDSTTIEAVRLYQTAPSVPDTLQGKPQSDTLQTPQPTGSNKRKSQPGSTAPTNGTAPATGNGQANNAIPTNTATAGNGTMQQNGEAAGTETSAKSSSPATTGANSAEEIQPSSSPHSLSPGEKAPQPAEPPRSGSDNGMETAVLSAS